MTTIKATVIADTIWDGKRISTLELVYPRIIHSEFMTHRVFSRNASSSRAIPVKRQIQAVREDPYFPAFWGANQPGMQAKEEEVVNPQDAYWRWHDALQAALNAAEALADIGVHKQHVNRLLEPFAHIRVTVTATGDVWPHFFDLRAHPDAQPEFQQLAVAIKQALSNSVKMERPFHYPYTTEEEIAQYPIDTLALLCIARCARVSYRTHDGLEPKLVEDLALASKLLLSKHLSPFEHAAKGAEGQFANFNGWQSHRNEMGY